MTTNEGAAATHLLVADLSRTACRLPVSPQMNTTTIADNATCKECIANSGRS